MSIVKEKPVISSQKSSTPPAADGKLFKETRIRSLSKTISWRCVAVLNSFTILSMAFSEHPFTNAIAMNISGFCVFYFFERIWNLIHWGRIPADGLGEAGKEVA